MTDFITSQNPFSPGNLPVKWKDLGDGTYAHGVASLPLPTGAAAEHITAASFHSVQLTTGAAFYDARQIRALTSADIVSAVQSGTWTVAQGTPPWQENLTQVGGSAITLKALPTGGLGLAAIPVTHNAIQLLTYTYGVRVLATGTLTASTAKALFSIEHAATSTKTVKIRRILVSGRQTTALAGSLDIQVTRGTAASTAGTAITAGLRSAGDAAAECVVKTLPTITAASIQDYLPLTAAPSAVAQAVPQTTIFDWQEGGETKAWTLRAGILETLVFNVISDAAQAYNLTIHLTVTEE